MAALRQWKTILSFELDRKNNIHEQIIKGITQEIYNGRLTPGMILPGYRDLAAFLSVNRNTIAAVYRELTGTGILKTQVRKGTFVTDALPSRVKDRVKKTQPITATSFSFNHFDEPVITTEIPPGYWQIRFDDGYPDPKQAPSGKFVATYKQMSFRQVRQKKSEYNSGNSYHKLCSEINKMLIAQRGLNMKDDNLCLILSVRMALYMVAQTLLQPGDYVVVENPGEAICWQTFQRAGAILCPVDVDQEGICTEKLEHLCLHKKIKAVYISPGCQYPTTVTLSPERRKHLLALSAHFGFAIIESDYDHEFCYERSTTLPLAATNIESNIIYIGNLSRMMAPLSLIAAVAGPRPFIQSLQSLYRSIYQRADSVLELTVTELLQMDVIGRHARTSLRAYQKKRDGMLALLDKYLSKHASYTSPPAGLAFFLKFNCDINKLRKYLSSDNIWVPQSNLISLSGSNTLPALRLGFASLSTKEAEKGIIAIAEALSK